MLRYSISEADLLAQIRQADPRWLAQARTRTRKFARLGRYQEKDSIWSRLKGVYRALQHDKCGYCERKLAQRPHGGLEHDIEHFRPKSAVLDWPPPPTTCPFPTGGPGRGYHALAYSPLNYLVSCKICNTIFKANYFPIEGRRSRSTSADPLAYASEAPLLVYPVGTIDEAPENLITFVGITPVPRVTRGIRHRRARVTIDLLGLHEREELLEERARKIDHLYLARQSADRGVEDGIRARTQLLAASSPHTNCARAFDELYSRDRAAARRIHRAVARYLDSK